MEASFTSQEFLALIGDAVDTLTAAETIRLYDCYLAGWNRARELPVRLQTDSSGQIPTRYMERRGRPEDDLYRDFGHRPGGLIEILRVEWRAAENMVYIFFCS